MNMEQQRKHKNKEKNKNKNKILGRKRQIHLNTIYYLNNFLISYSKKWEKNNYSFVASMH
jgi:hypothetical protein